MKILLSSQVREADAYTIKNEPIASIELMERACHAFIDAFEEHHQATSPVWVVCGTGNNGGDGLGIARLLHDRGFTIEVFIEGKTESGSADFRTNLERIKDNIAIHSAGDVYSRNAPKSLVIIDALFGSGLSRPLEGAYAKLVGHLNSLDAKRVAVDIPSGLFAEKPQADSVAFMAHETISFQVPKLCFVLPENYRYVGNWKVVNIGLSADFLERADTPFYLQQAGDVDLCLPERSVFTHKGDAGRVLLVSGSRGKVGAAILASRACMRAGAGLLTVHTPGCAVTPIHAAVPEAMIDEDADSNFISSVGEDQLAGYDAIAAGPGLGTDVQTVRALESLFRAGTKPMVIDADALNAISQNPKLKKAVPPGSVLTPHPGEFKRLVGPWANDYERLDKQVGFSKEHGVTIVLKGAYSAVSTPDGIVYFNSTGNPGMATAGSGDVLTGIVAGLMAQGFSPQKSARLAVLAHGISGDLAAEVKGEYGLVASDLVDMLPLALKKLQSFGKKMNI